MSRESIKKEDRKMQKRFFIVLIICMVLGGFTGAAGVRLVDFAKEQSWDFVTFTKELTRNVSFVTRYLLPIVNGVVLPVLFVRYLRHKKEVYVMDGEDEVQYDTIDKKLGLDLLFSGIMFMMNMFLYGTAFYGMMEQNTKSVIFAVDIAVFLGGMICLVFYQKAIVNLVKELNPEKQGSVFDTRFKDKWFASCDEAERQKIGMAAYGTYRIMSGIYGTLSFVLMIAGFFFPIGLMPFVLVSVLWLLQMIIYSVKTK